MSSVEPHRLDVRDYVRAFGQAHLIAFQAPFRFSLCAAILLGAFFVSAAGVPGVLAMPVLIACAFVASLKFAWSVDRRREYDAPGLVSIFRDSWLLLVYTLRRVSGAFLFALMVGTSVVVTAIALQLAPLRPEMFVDVSVGSFRSSNTAVTFLTTLLTTLAAPTLVVGFYSWVGLIGAGTRILLRQLSDPQGADWLWIAGNKMNDPLWRHADVLVLTVLFLATIFAALIGVGWIGALYFALIYPVWTYVLFRMIYLGRVGRRIEVPSGRNQCLTNEQI